MHARQRYCSRAREFRTPTRAVIYDPRNEIWQEYGTSAHPSDPTLFIRATTQSSWCSSRDKMSGRFAMLRSTVRRVSFVALTLIYYFVDCKCSVNLRSKLTSYCSFCPEYEFSDREDKNFCVFCQLSRGFVVSTKVLPFRENSWSVEIRANDELKKNLRVENSRSVF